MTPERKRNLLVLPVIIFVRIPLLLPFWILARIGEGADAAGEFISRRLPGWNKEYTQK